MAADLKDKIALVTGSSQGIGRAIALKLAEQEAHVIVTYSRNLDKGEEVVKTIKSLGGKADLIKLDLQNLDVIEISINGLLKKFNSIDILVNNAGTSGFIGPVVETPLTEWKNLLDVNLNSVFLLCKFIIPKMIQKNYGRIINIGSIAYRKNPANTASYNVSKAGLNALTKTISKEVGQYGITVNAIAPGLVLTDRIKNVRLPGLAKTLSTSEDEIYKKMVNDTDTKQLATEEDIAELVLFLASDKGKSITSEIIDVSGGI